MIYVNLFPELIGSLWLVIHRFQNLPIALGKCLVKIDMAQHNIRISAAYTNLRNAIVCTGSNAPFLSWPLDLGAGIIRFVYIGFKRIDCKVIIRGTDIGIGKPLAHQPQCAVVVSGGIVMIDHNAYLVLAAQIQEVLLFIPHHNGDIRNTGFKQLLNLTLNKNFTTYAEQALRTLVGNGCKARRQSCCHNDCIVYLVRFKRINAALCKYAICYISRSFAAFKCRIHRTERKPC